MGDGQRNVFFSDQTYNVNNVGEYIQEVILVVEIIFHLKDGIIIIKIMIFIYSIVLQYVSHTRVIDASHVVLVV